MIWKYIDCLWTVIFTQRVMLCFTWLTSVFCDLDIFYCVILNCWELSSMVGKPQQGVTDYKGIVLFIVLCIDFAHFYELLTCSVWMC
jgi:hypothetical protein